MASRRRAREFALQALYKADLAGTSAGEALEALLLQQQEGGVDERIAEGEEPSFARRIVAGVDERREDLDSRIESASVNWRIPRMPVVDRNILRLAAYELVASKDVPASVSINEALELAKKYGDKGSRAFVNGILDRIAGELGRGGRRQRDA